MIDNAGQLCFTMGVVFSLAYAALLTVSLMMHRSWAVETLEPK